MGGLFGGGGGSDKGPPEGFTADQWAAHQRAYMSVGPGPAGDDKNIRTTTQYRNQLARAYQAEGLGPRGRPLDAAATLAAAQARDQTPSGSGYS